MDVHNRFERRSLRDVLIDQGVLTSELADELISSARENGEPFGAVVVEGAHMTPWDLAKVVATHYQMPFLPLVGFDYEKGLATGISTATLYHYQVIPVGRFGKTISFAVVEPPSRDCIAALQEACDTNSLFFFVGEVQEVDRLLRENVKVVDSAVDTAWQEIFDCGDRNVLDDVVEVLDDVVEVDDDGEIKIVVDAEDEDKGEG